MGDHTPPQRQKYIWVGFGVLADAHLSCDNRGSLGGS